MAADMISDAKTKIEAVGKRLREITASIGTASGEDAPRRRQFIDQYLEILRDYVLIEATLKRDRSIGARQSLRDLHEMSPLGKLSDVSRILQTTLPGTRIVKLVVSQVFRIDDLLTAPPHTIRPSSVLENVASSNTLRRTLNRNASLELPGFGSLRSVRTTQLELREFWNCMTGDLPIGSGTQICFVPFEMTPIPALEGFRPDLESVLEEALMNAVGGAGNLITNVQIDSRMRLYSPGVGVARVSITVTFADVAYVEVLARIAREIESLLFVGPGEQQKDVASLFDDAVRAMVAALFVDESAQHAERRWRPPDVSFVLYDDGFDPTNRLAELARLVALAPGNIESAASVESRLARVTASNEWKANGILAFAGHRSALLLGAKKGGRAVAAKRKQTINMLLELQEVIAAGAHVQQLFEEKLQEITAGGLLDDTWSSPGERLDYLLRLMRAMRLALRAVMSLKLAARTTWRRRASAICKAALGAPVQATLNASGEAAARHQCLARRANNRK